MSFVSERANLIKKGSLYEDIRSNESRAREIIKPLLEQVLRNNPQIASFDVIITASENASDPKARKASLAVNVGDKPNQFAARFTTSRDTYQGLNELATNVNSTLKSLYGDVVGVKMDLTLGGKGDVTKHTVYVGEVMDKGFVR